MSHILPPSYPLPEHVRQALFPLPRAQWCDHDNFLTSDARALLRNHAALKQQARQYHGAIRYLANLSDQDRRREDNLSLLTTLQQHLQSLLRNLHSHHGFEDSSVFPAVRLQHPRLSCAIDLMEQDHAALDQLLAQLQTRSLDLPTALTLPQNLEQALAEADNLERLLHGHMQNEEEILVPAYLIYS